jgi:hypothetical protein
MADRGVEIVDKATYNSHTDVPANSFSPLHERSVSVPVAASVSNDLQGKNIALGLCREYDWADIEAQLFRPVPVAKGAGHRRSLSLYEAFIETYDSQWLAVAYCILLLVTFLIPFAVVFNITVLNYVWWFSGLIILASIVAMRYSNRKISSSHTTFFFMFVVVASRYAILSTIVAGPFFGLFFSSIQLVFLICVMVS